MTCKEFLNELTDYLDGAIEPPAQGVLGHRLVWESLGSFYTPNDEFFTVKHYGDVRLSASAYRLAIEGLVAHPQLGDHGRHVGDRHRIEHAGEVVDVAARQRQPESVGCQLRHKQQDERLHAEAGKLSPSRPRA